MRASVVALLAVCLMPNYVDAGDGSRLDDAAIHAIHFVDDNEGWAVGDEGVIWHTIDAGQTWERQASSTRAALRGICFLDPFTGFVIGRESLPLGAGSAGIVLYTNDGGTRWHRASVRELPGLRQIKFLNRRNGVLVGEASDQHPTGLFTTEDGGITWKLVPGPRVPGWSTADVLDAQNVLLGGPWGGLGMLRGRDFIAADADNLAGRSIHAVQFQGRTAWAVGEGLLLLKGDHGKKWTYSELDFPPEVRRSWDLHAMHFIGSSAWIVGRPGSLVLHTADGGTNWETQSTGQALPLHAIHFVDDKTGWAAGELGTILRTNDAGKTWKVQRRGGHRVAILTVSAQRGQTPVGILGTLGADDGYLTASVGVTCSDPAQGRPLRAFDTDRLVEGIRLAGGCAGEILWQFPMPQHMQGATAQQFTRHWASSQDPNRGMEDLVRQLVLAIRTWRPDVVVTDSAGDKDRDVESLVAFAVGRAFELAAKPDAFPEQLATLRLEPWAPSKLYGRSDDATNANVILDLDTPRQSLRSAPNDYVSQARALLQDEGDEVTPAAYFKLLSSRVDHADKHRALMDGIKLGPGGQARRDPTPVTDVTGWDQIVKAAQQRRDFHAIAKQQLTNPTIAKQIPSMLPKTLKDLPENQAGEAAYALGRSYAQSGQWLMAREVFTWMVDKYPSHPLAPEACRWLIRFGSSSEARRRDELGNFTIQGHVWNEPIASENGAKAFLRVDQTATGPLSLRAMKKGQEFGEDLRNWYKSALALEDVLAGLGPIHANDPTTQFCLQSAKRGLGKFEETDVWYVQFTQKQPLGPWHDAAAAETWLGHRSGIPPKPVLNCTAIEEPPFLDGKLDEECWTKSTPTVLKDAVGMTAANYQTEVWLAHDNTNLYLALRCKHPEGPGNYAAPVKPRTRDADLRPFDRVSLLLDLDRDYCTYYHLQVDQRGCTWEDCWGDKSWNPTWYVAVHSDATSWQIEAAIPLTELTGNPIGTGQTWAGNVVRTLPGRGVQAFSTPADAMPRPDGMGLVHFPALGKTTTSTKGR